MTKEETEKFLQEAKLFFEQDDVTLLKLTGFYGVHTKADIDRPTTKITVQKHFPFKITIFIRSEKIKRATREINYYNKIIFNHGFFSTRSEDRTGLKCLNDQVKAARELGFKALFVKALRDEYQEYDDFIYGYYSWGRYGYLMNNFDQIDKFLSLMEEKKTEVYNLYDLVRNPKGKSFWLATGETWSGYFDVSPQSTSSLILDQVYKELAL